jgi:Ca2+-transporting ATPase
MSLAVSPEESESASLLDEGNPFDFSAEALSNLFDPKDLEAFESLGGLGALEVGLKTNLQAGIYEDEDLYHPPIGYGTLSRRSTIDDESRKHASRVAIFGQNQLPEKRAKGLGQLMLEAISDKVMLLLTVAALVSLGLGLYQSFGQPHGPGQPRVEWIEGVSILTAVAIAVGVGALNDWQKERQFIKLNRKSSDRLVRVTRSGMPREISIHDILVGDVIHLNQGDVAPVDGVLIKGYNVNCDESSLTGETRVVKKMDGQQAIASMTSGSNVNKLDPFIMSGSVMLEGTGSYLALCVGVHSTNGKLLTSLSEDTESTPLQKKLARVADQIAIAGFSVAVVLFLTLTIKFLSTLPSSSATPSERAQTFLQIVIVSISLVVVAVPEGLPLAVTLALAIAVVRMLKDNNLVRVLAACETMGNATTVCCDKTGTLTMNEMTVTSGIVGAARFGYAEDESAENSVSISDFAESLPTELRELLIESIILNTTAFETQKDGKYHFVGQQTEVALLEFLREHFGIRPINHERASANIVELVPFDSSRKYMACVVKLGAGSYRLFVKGAPEILLGNSTKAVTCAGALKQPALTADTERVFKNVLSEFTQHALRAIGFAFRDYSAWPPKGWNHERRTEDFLDQLTFVGVFGLQDPLRPGVKEAVNRCFQAGVGIKMVTGDNLGTAKAIASESGILTEDGVVMEGVQFRKLSAADMDSIVPRLQVLARSSPEDKKILVKKLKQLGQIVAVTGDGTNDGPALRAADVGFSMGISGTDVAKEASSIVLMDDNFASIVKAIEWGRTVNDAIKKFLQVCVARSNGQANL